MSFNPRDYLIKLSGKDYLETKWRVVWFREEQPTGSIETELIHYEDGLALVKATVSIDGRIISTGIANADSRIKKTLWTGKEVMKAETAAIGRALAHAGYGTQFTGDEGDEGDYLSDSPVERKQQPTPQYWILDDKRYAKFVAWCMFEIGITKEEIPIALDVDMRSDYKGTEKEAVALVESFAGNGSNSNGDKPAALQTTMANGAKFMQNKKGGDFTVLLFDGEDTGIILGTRDHLRKVSKTIENYVKRWEHGGVYDFTAPLIVEHTGNDIHSISEDIPL